jgi:hypothetical protein
MTKANDSPAKARGRRRTTDIVTVAASRCRKCGSTEREGYFNTNETPASGIDADGRPYTHVVRRWTRCRNCGQTRIDRAYENRPAEVRLANESRPLSTEAA